VVRVDLRVSPEGLLRRFEAKGHAGAVTPGDNIACAAATVLLRTAGRVCAEHGVPYDGGAGGPGEMRLVVSLEASSEVGWLRGVTDYLVRGMKDLQDEFPNEIILRVEMTEG
jgi:uncharacterized protein YsxB (DUF464 family)